MSYSATISTDDTLDRKIPIVASCLLEQLSWLLGLSHFCTLLPYQGLALTFIVFSPVEPEADKTFQIIITADHFAGPAAYKTFHALSL